MAPSSPLRVVVRGTRIFIIQSEALSESIQLLRKFNLKVRPLRNSPANYCLRAASWNTTDRGRVRVHPGPDGIGTTPTLRRYTQVPDRVTILPQIHIPPPTILHSIPTELNAKAANMTLRNKDKPVERDDIHEHCPLDGGGWETGVVAAAAPSKDIVNKVSWTKIGNGVPLSRQIHLMYFLMEGITLREIYCVTVIWIRISRGAAIRRLCLHSPPLCGRADTLHRKEWHELLPLELRGAILKSFPSWLRNVLVGIII